MTDRAHLKALVDEYDNAVCDEVRDLTSFAGRFRTALPELLAEVERLEGGLAHIAAVPLYDDPENIADDILQGRWPHGDADASRETRLTQLEARLARLTEAGRAVVLEHGDVVNVYSASWERFRALLEEDR